MTQAAQTSSPTRVSASGDSLGSGAAGIALLHIEQARAGTGSWGRAQEWAAAMTRDPVTAHPDIASLYRGAPAVAFALHTAGHPGYTAALETLDGHITTLTRHRLQQAHDRIECGQLPALREFDLISGLTGIGAYLLHRGRDPSLLREVLAYLVGLTEPIDADGDTLPGWWCGHSPADQPADRWPGGHGNLGLAHGIAGPLALLSTTMRRGVTVAEHREAISGICRWLDQWRVCTGQRAWWPERITRAEWRTGSVAQRGPGRPSWCYGTPGLARAQQLADLTLGDPWRQRQAENALLGCVTDEHQLAHLTDATLCHGWAGLIHTVWRAAAEPGAAVELTAAVPQLRARLEQHLNRHGLPENDGLLEGTAGIQLVQRTIAAAPGQRPASHWDACLLLDC